MARRGAGCTEVCRDANHPWVVPHKALLRALWAMLYAHYEGFCLYALSIFLDEVKK
jgi:MAE_28990/MAE_18760-like HEPN